MRGTARRGATALANRALSATYEVNVCPAPALAPLRRTFVAIDFETADNSPDSACAIGLVRVEDGVIVARETRLIRPPRRTFVFTYVHGIEWAHVANAPTFGALWPTLTPILDGAEFLAAHHAPFDQGVLHACCDAHGLPRSPLPFVDTVMVARRAWNLRPTKLNSVCDHLQIPLNHHEAGSDAEACARIVIAAGADLP